MLPSKTTMNGRRVSSDSGETSDRIAPSSSAYEFGLGTKTGSEGLIVGSLNVSYSLNIM